MSFTNILTYDSDKKMKEYDELVKKFGLDKALEILSSTGDIYDGDVVEDKKNKMILDDETIKRLAGHLKAPEKIEIQLSGQEESIIIADNGSIAISETVGTSSRQEIQTIIPLDLTKPEQIIEFN